MPAILKTEFGIGQGKAGVSATLFWQAAAVVGAVVGGWLADRWMRTNPRGRIYVSAIGTALIVPAMFGVGYAPQTGQLWVAVTFLILFGLGWGFFDSNNMPILCQIARPDLRATGYGIMNLVSISAGGFADKGFGIMRDRNLPLSGFSACSPARRWFPCCWCCSFGPGKAKPRKRKCTRSHGGAEGCKIL
jgi:MFS family permease